MTEKVKESYAKDVKKLLPAERKQKILSYVKEKRAVTIQDLSTFFNVHDATIRRDLSALEAEGKLKRTHGGVVFEDEVHSEPPFGEREAVLFEEKQRMGQLAASFIESGDNIILDSGTTTVHIADAIIRKKVAKLTVITNDINIAAKLRFTPEVKVIVTGGTLFPESYMLNGMITDEVLKKLHVHKAFIGTPAFHYKVGLTHFDEELVPAKNAMIHSAKEVFVIADHTKIDRISLYNVAELREIDTLITTSELDHDELEKFKDTKLNVQLA